MSRKKELIFSICIAFLGAALLGKASQMLYRVQYPLVSSLICIETSDPADLYWNINQIEISGTVDTNGNRTVITLCNNIPNFESYFFRIDGDDQWQQSGDGRIVVEGGNGSHTMELKATNTLGGELPSRVYTIEVVDRAVTIMPDDGKIERGRYSFRFEKPGSEKIIWLRERILPVIAASSSQWNAALALRTWVRKQIPNRHPTMKSRWDAQYILQSVWNDPSLGFICDAYAATYISACLSVGLHARMIHLGDEDYNGHYATEVWSDEHEKWIFMDPLYDCHFSVEGTPLTAMELHNLWMEGRMGMVTTHATGGARATPFAPASDYLNLFQDIQLVNANDFLTTPFDSVLDLLTLKIRFLRYIDDANPAYNRVRLACQIFIFYYLPILISGLIIPFGIPAIMIYLIFAQGRRNR